MRVVSWNMAYWKPARYKSDANRQRQWSALMVLSPDIALLQECRPDDLATLAPSWASPEYQVLGSIPPRWQACSAVLVRRSLDAMLVQDEDPYFAFLSGYVTRAILTIAGIGSVSIASVHAVAKEVLSDALDPEVLATMRRPACDRAWYNDLAANALRTWASDAFIVGGDWNTARLFDEHYADRWPEGSQQFFDRMAKWNWAESMRKFHDSEVQTYFDANSRPYQLDHLFTDALLHDCLERCDVLEEPAIRELSDHAPILCEFRLP
jgi:exonuclease III